MRLIDTSTYEIKEFLGDNVPHYAILSHTWDDNEITLKDMIDGDFEAKDGFRKVKSCCERARKDGFKHAWIDTCCIDKTSSAELSEAINSMFRWYKECSVCYAFLSDIEGDSFYSNARESLGKCRWFTRSWTLQELLAPETVIFFDRDWAELGTASRLASELAEITKIPISLFLDSRNLTSHSVADRLSWAANRQATRIEDRAYSLLGLFNINMPLLYGEGSQAFTRLQRKIIKSSEDLSIFAWSKPATGHNVEAPEISWLLAESVDDFANLGSIERQSYHSRRAPPGAAEHSSPLRLTPYSIELDLPLTFKGAPNGKALAYLECKLTGTTKHLCAVLMDEGHGDWSRLQEIAILDRDEKYMRETFWPKRLQFLVGKSNVFSDGGVGLLPMSMQMPTLYLSISSDSPAIPLRAELRYLIDRQTGPSKQCVDGPSCNLTYAIVTTDGPNWQKFTDISLTELSASTAATGRADIVLQPHLANMHFYMGVISTIVVVEILAHEKTLIAELVIGMRMSDYGPQVYIQTGPAGSRGDVDKLWNMHPRGKDVFEGMELLTMLPLNKASWKVSGTVRPRGCGVHEAGGCACRSRQVNIHVECIEHATYTASPSPPPPPPRTRSGRKRKASTRSVKVGSAVRRKLASAQGDWKIKYTPIWLANCHLPGFPKPGDPNWSVAMAV